MICHEVPTRPWEKIAVDLFQLNGRDYMVTTDYYSSFFEVDSLTTKTAVEVIRKLKVHLTRHGIPDQVVSDNGQPSACDQFPHVCSVKWKSGECRQDSRITPREGSQIQAGPISVTVRLEEHFNRRPKLFTCPAAIWSKNENSPSHL